MSKENFWLEKIEFIGREAIIDDIQGRLKNGDFNLMFFKGGYGMGKTRLLSKILQTTNPGNHLSTPDGLIDLYHTRNHSAEGLAQTLVKLFSKQEEYFERYFEERSSLDEARISGDSAKAGEKLKSLLSTCKNALIKISKEKGILILLDTTERWIYPLATETKTEFAPAWSWFKELLSELPRGMVVLAGRDEIQELSEDINLPTQVVKSLEEFSIEEIQEYLNSFVKNKDRSGSTGSLIAFDQQEIIDLKKLSGGRPILLVLYLELILDSPEFRQGLDKIAPNAFEEELIKGFMTNQIIGQALSTIGRAPKGVDLELLSLLRGISSEVVKGEYNELKNMAFAKFFVDSDRLFLHDQVYELLQKYHYVGDIDIAEQKRSEKIIEEYYLDHISADDNLLTKLFERISNEVEGARTVGNVVQAIRSIESPRQVIKTEFVYYGLRSDVKIGLQDYYRYGHEAATSGNHEILILLRVELINFMKTLDVSSPWQPFIRGFLLVNSIWENLASGAPYIDKCIEYKDLLGKLQNLTKDQEGILSALLDTWRATGIVFSRDPHYDQAEEILTNSIKRIQSIIVSPDDDLYWFQKVVESLSFRQRAYMRRIRGEFQSSIMDFTNGLKNSRAIHFFHEEATLRNDLGFAQMQMGEFQAAIANMEDGLQLRFRTAIGPRIVLSYTSMAQFHISYGAYDEARKRAQYAVRISEAINFQRGLAFGHLALAEATRRYSFTAWGRSTQKGLLLEAKEYIDKASYLFGRLGERARIIDSDLEQACLYRSLLRVADTQYDKDMWFEKAKIQLERVAEQAREAKIDYRYVDAMCNRVWLGYYAGIGEDKNKRQRMWDFAEQAAQEFRSLDVLAPFWISKGKPQDEEKSKRNPILWAQIGRYYMGLGMINLGIWNVSHDLNTIDSASFEQAANNMLLALEYSTRFAADHRGIREAHKTIHSALASLNLKELTDFSSLILRAEKQENLSGPSELQKVMIGHALWFAD